MDKDESVRTERKRAEGFHTEVERRENAPHSVLVFAFLFGHLVWVQHPSRGWEVPGGKVERDESPEQAVVRETYEEAGLELTNVTWVAEYKIWVGGQWRPKWVYIADVEDVSTRPSSSEIVDVQLFRPELSPTEAMARADVSFVMKDDVYHAMWPIVIHHARRSE